MWSLKQINLYWVWKNEIFRNFSSSFSIIKSICEACDSTLDSNHSIIYNGALKSATKLMIYKSFTLLSLILHEISIRHPQKFKISQTTILVFTKFKIRECVFQNKWKNWLKTVYPSIKWILVWGKFNKNLGC